jgi:hypothetical protein
MTHSRHRCIAATNPHRGRVNTTCSLRPLDWSRRLHAGCRLGSLSHRLRAPNPTPSLDTLSKDMRGVFCHSDSHHVRRHLENPLNFRPEICGETASQKMMLAAQRVAFRSRSCRAFHCDIVAQFAQRSLLGVSAHSALLQQDLPEPAGT